MKEDQEDKELLKAEEYEKKERELDELFEIVKLIRPGTKLRTAIDEIVKAGFGALIVIGDNPNVINIVNGGFKIDCKFSPQQLIELSKMDGAIILSNDLKKIIFCNTLLVPNHNISTDETGTRHKAAERTAKQTSCPVIAVSERRKTVTLYYKNLKYKIRSTEEILSKTIETLRMLEKHKEILDELLINLNVLEFSGLETLKDVVFCLQRMEIMSRITKTIKRYLIELGSEGHLVSLMLKEITKGLNEEKELLIMDYSRNWKFTKTVLSTFNIKELSETENIIRALLYTNMLEHVNSLGHRLLSKISLNQEVKESLLKYFKNLGPLLESIEKDPDSVVRVIGEKHANKLIKEFKNLKEQALLGKRI